ncbi:MAG TPA: tRNA 2-selenouridine(34) synthase MnmH [Bacteroidales bacterium]
MVPEINISDFYRINVPLIDVRSPAEYARGHIPGVVNIPLFSDEERAHVGITYVQQSREKAMDLGYKYVTPKLDSFISQSKQVAPDGRVVVHCWRGGMRSQSFAQHLLDNGFPDVSVISGGYKAFRHYVLDTFNIPFNLRIVGGYTGSGKTHIIARLRDMGWQAVDLEDLAGHKGSAFGSIVGKEQPTVEQFENNLFDVWRKLDYSKPIWLEDESHNIGGVNIPMNLFNQMRNNPVYFLDIPREERAKHLVAEYAGTDKESLAESIRKISKRLDGLKTKEAFQYLDEGNFYEVASIALTYYDRTYKKGMRFRSPDKIYVIPGYSTNPQENTKLILKIYQIHERYKIDSI